MASSVVGDRRSSPLSAATVQPVRSDGGVVAAHGGAKRSLRARNGVLAVGIAGVLAVGIIAVLISSPWSPRVPGAPPGPAPSSSSSTTTTRSPNVPPGRLTELEAELVSADPAQRAHALHPAVAAALAETSALTLPLDSTIRIDPLSLQGGDTTASVTAVVVGGSAAGPWQLLLVKESGEWVVYAASAL